MELTKLTENVYYIENSAKIGIIRKDDRCIIIDSGIDDDSARKISNLLKSENLKPIALINTHSHADHCGGNSFLKKRDNVKIYASKLEGAIIENTILEPMYLYSASPIKEVMGKFLMAKPSEIDHIITEPQIEIEGIKLDIVKLPGHSPEQIGISYDNILFCADSIFSKTVFEKHKIPFHMDIDATIQTLEFLKGSRYAHYLPSHTEEIEDIKELSQINIDSINKVKEIILSIIDSKTTEDIIKKTLDHYNIKTKTTQQYVLLKTAIIAYLSSLQKAGKINTHIENNSLIWKKHD